MVYIKYIRKVAAQSSETYQNDTIITQKLLDNFELLRELHETLLQLNYLVQKKQNLPYDWRMYPYLESCQNDRLSSSGTTSVAFNMRATATMSQICHK